MKRSLIWTPKYMLYLSHHARREAQEPFNIDWNVSSFISGDVDLKPRICLDLVLRFRIPILGVDVIEGQLKH